MVGVPALNETPIPSQEFPNPPIFFITYRNPPSISIRYYYKLYSLTVLPIGVAFCGMNRVLSFLTKRRGLANISIVEIVVGLPLGLLYLAGFVLIVLLLSVPIGLLIEWLPPLPSWLKDLSSPEFDIIVLLSIIAVCLVVDEWRSKRRFRKKRKESP